MGIRSFEVKIIQQKRRGFHITILGQNSERKDRTHDKSWFLRIRVQKKIKKAIPLMVESQKIKYLGSNATKEMKD